jgi:RNA recognition motif-containing protein
MKEFGKLGYFSKEEHVTTLYLSGISYKKTEKDLKKMFEKFGKVVYVKVVMDYDKERSKGIAFIQMNNRNHAQAAINKLHNSIQDGRTFKVEIAKNKNIKNVSARRPSSIPEVAEAPVKPKMRRRDKAKNSGLNGLKNFLNNR